MNNPENGPVDVAEVRAWMAEHKERTGMSWKAIADASGIKQGTLSAWIYDSYQGNAENVARSVIKYRQLVESQSARAEQEQRAGLRAEPGYLEMPTALRVRTLLTLAHRGAMTLAAMGPGTSKTASAQHYAASIANVLMITIRPTKNSVAAMVADVVRAMNGKAGSGWVRLLSDQVIDHVRGRGMLLIVDEANHLETAALDPRLVALAMNEALTQAHAYVIVAGEKYLRDAKGALIPVDAVKPVDLLMDETVRKINGFARLLSDEIARFRGHAFEDVGAFQALIAQEYGASVGGAKGNITLTTFDGCQKVQVQVADLIEFGPELQAAKSLIDACLTEWSADSRTELRALVNRVFQVDKEGKINRAELFMLLRVEIEDGRWQQAMAAIRDSIRIIGSKTYIRFYERAAPDEKWRAITIDLAAAS